jgi:hypothetical protein
MNFPSSMYEGGDYTSMLMWSKVEYRTNEDNYIALVS